MEDHALRPFEDGFQFALDEAYEDGLVDRPFEVIHRSVDGLPWGNTHNVATAWRELADQGVVCIFGPLISENAIAVRSYIEEIGKVPSISITGTDRWYGDYCFNINNGSLPEDPYLMANYLAVNNIRTVAVIYDLSAIGREYREFFREACDFEGVTVAREDGIGQAQTDTRAMLELAREANAEALAYLGYGLPAVHMNRALAEMDWNPTRVMNTSFMTGPTIPEGLASLKGRVGCDQYDEENAVGQDFLDRFEAKYNYRPQNFMSVLAYDCGAVVAQAASKASPLSPEGMKLGLERVKMLPGATGGPGSVISFGPFMRRGWLTPDFIIMREVDPAFEGEITLMGASGTVLRHRLTPRTHSQRAASRARSRSEKP